MFVGLHVGVYVGVHGRRSVLKEGLPIFQKSIHPLSPRVFDYVLEDSSSYLFTFYTTYA
jgi:hypothetical protein